MPFPFALVCNLLDECYSLCVAGKPYTKAVVSWFANHRSLIDAHDTCLASLLSTLLPDKRPDRVYSIQTSRLVKIVARALIPGSSRIAELTRFKLPGSGVDLADCVESILTATPNALHSKESHVTIEDIDQILHEVASTVRWSSPAIRRRSSSFLSCDHATLETTYRKLTAREAKWLTRLILKNYQPLALDCHLVYRCCHPLLPLLLKFRDDFVSALKILQDAKSAVHYASESNITLRTRILDSLKPQFGVKVARQNWLKARSIKHCIDLGHGRMSVETKMDGEYCQIHVDAAHGPPRIQIFSKSGKDSTEDRVGLHDTIAQSLKLGSLDCKVRKQCILEGELVVYSDKENKILPFHKIRNHVSRRGLFLNVEQDSPPRDCEHLMIIYFDILLLDDDSLLATRHSERFKILERIVSQRQGWSELIQRQVIDFRSHYASSDLRNAFASIIVAKDEGLVLKPDEPYFNLEGFNKSLAGCCIKLKKEYIGNFGDVGDFAVVGAGFNAAKAKSYNIPNVKWTHFFIGCITNKEKAKNPQINSEFTVVNVVELNKTQIGTLLKFGTPLPLSVSENKAIKVQVPRGIDTSTPMTVIFQNPLVFDLRCFSFDKPGNVGFWTLRFPVVSKIHFDRDYTDTVSFDELQQMAKEATTIPEVKDSQENLAWVAKLESADPMDSNLDAISQMTTTATISTLSDSNSTQSTSVCASPMTRKPAAPACRSSTPLGPTDGFRSSLRSDKPDAEYLIPSSPPILSCEGDKSTGVSSRPKSSKRLSTWVASASPLSKKRRTREIGKEATSSTECIAREPLNNIHGNASKAVGTSYNCAKTRPGVPDSEAKENKSATLSDKNPVTPLVTTDPALDGCSYAGPKCCLANFDVLISSASLTKDPEPVALFRTHGVLHSALCLDLWLQGNAKIHISPERLRASILFVDSVENALEVKDIIKRIKVAREELPRCKSNRITIYDWRLLKHLSIFEDKNITKKYYDGFNDPWRRWFCGVI